MTPPINGFFVCSRICSGVGFKGLARTSNVPPPRSKISTWCSPRPVNFLSRPYAIAAAVGSLMMRSTCRHVKDIVRNHCTLVDFQRWPDHGYTRHTVAWASLIAWQLRNKTQTACSLCTLQAVHWAHTSRPATTPACLIAWRCESLSIPLWLFFPDPGGKDTPPCRPAMTLASLVAGAAGR